MKAKSPFARFDRTLAEEHRAKTLQDVELGFAEAPKDPRKTGRPRKSGSPRRSRELVPDKNGRVPITFDAPPAFTAAMALTAARNGTNTKAETTRWLELLATYGKPPEMDPHVSFTMHLTVGPGAFPEDLFRELCIKAREFGCEPGDLATAIVRKALAERKGGAVA